MPKNVHQINEPIRLPDGSKYDPLKGPDYSPRVEESSDLRLHEKDERTESSVTRHRHDGQSSQRIDFFTLQGLIDHRTTAPTHTPKNIGEQIVLYDTGGVRRLYLYVNNAWRLVVLT